MAQFRSKRGLDWYYEEHGKHEAILFIHGFGGSSAYWGRQVEFLAKDFHVITVDLPGHGQSAWMDVSINEMAIDLKELMQSLHIEHFSIVACSFGGLIAMELYRVMPEHSVMRMSFVGSLPKFARSAHYPAGLDIEKIHKLSNQFETNVGSVLDMFFRSLFTMKERESESFKWAKAMRAHEPLPQKEALKAFLVLLEKTDMRDRLASIICPLQFIAGSDDYICTKDMMNWMAEHAYNARFDFIDGSGHLPFLTEVEEYNRLLDDFLLN